MKKKILFFSVGFAFNRLVRLRYYEKIFPKNVEIFLITTNKYGDKESQEKKWNLERTKVIVLNHSPIKNIFEIRKFCNNNKITHLTNLGHPFGTIPLIFSKMFYDRKLLMYYLGDVFEIHKTTKPLQKRLKLLFIIIPYFILSKFADKIAFVGHKSYEKANILLLSPKSKFHFLHGPVNVDLFRPFKKNTSRKKLGLKDNKKIVIYVGRVTYLKGGDLLSKLVKLNPNIQFIIIGKWNEKEIPLIKSENLKFIESVLNQDLPEYYSAADLTFVYNRQGDQLQIVGVESLSCGTPILHTSRVHAPDVEFIIKVKDNIDEANEKLNLFLKKTEKQRKNISKKARNYSISNLSDEYWKPKYLKFFFN